MKGASLGKVRDQSVCPSRTSWTSRVISRAKELAFPADFRRIKNCPDCQAAAFSSMGVPAAMAFARQVGASDGPFLRIVLGEIGVEGMVTIKISAAKTARVIEALRRRKIPDGSAAGSRNGKPSEVGRDGQSSQRTQRALRKFGLTFGFVGGKIKDCDFAGRPAA